MLRQALEGLLLAATLAAPTAAQTVDEIVAKSLEARGGLERLRAVRTVRMTGRMSMGPSEVPMVVEIKRPASLRREITVEGSLAVQAYDGTTAWGIAPMGAGQAEALPAEAAKEMRDQADLDGPLVDSAAKGVRVELVGRAKVEGREAYELKVTRRSGDVEHDFLDARSYLPVRVEARRTVRGAEVELESTIGDYRESGGILWPYSITNSVKGRPERQTITVEKIEVNPPIDDARFKMPAARPAEPPKQD
jgi:outer membrane lipoprotein-sorting protein